jgi:hypothetical protein
LRIFRTKLVGDCK